ncbi:hypothetical protein J1605_020412 [Eschrichtius robustus]|uniref:Uncharacterized protein n=1 Tax=Eschrichtius robustus TaxID=9764 RepID=A0AB34HLD0_ESCRO|nr:hypothetical protein J1605_020412 [Eschrichtius robustus]
MVPPPDPGTQLVREPLEALSLKPWGLQEPQDFKGGKGSVERGAAQQSLGPQSCRRARVNGMLCMPLGQSLHSAVALPPRALAENPANTCPSANASMVQFSNAARAASCFLQAPPRGAAMTTEAPVLGPWPRADTQDPVTPSKGLPVDQFGKEAREPAGQQVSGLECGFRPLGSGVEGQAGYRAGMVVRIWAQVLLGSGLSGRKHINQRWEVNLGCCARSKGLPPAPVISVTVLGFLLGNLHRYCYERCQKCGSDNFLLHLDNSWSLRHQGVNIPESTALDHQARQPEQWPGGVSEHLEALGRWLQAMPATPPTLQVTIFGSLCDSLDLARFCAGRIVCQSAVGSSPRIPGARADRTSPDSDAVRGCARAAQLASNVPGPARSSGGSRSRGRPDPGVIVGLHRPEPSCPGLALPLRAKLGQAPAPPGARPWTGREGPALCQGRRDSSPPPGPRPRDWPLHWSVRRADVSGRDFPGPNLPGRRRAETRLSQSGPGQCPRFRASQAVSRDR